jgi:hypothetical protein
VTRRAAVLSFAALLLWAALYNGFPLVYNDTGTYLWSGGTLSLPSDRPVFYGLFLRAAFVKFSVWLPALLQCLLSSWLVVLTVEKARPATGSAARVFLGLLLAFGTALPWFSGQLMADVFAGWLALSLYLLVVHAGALSRAEKAGLAAVFCAAVLCHSSSAPVAVLMLALLALDARLRPALRLPALLLPAALLAGSVVTRTLARDGARPRYTHVWLTARLLDTGLARRLLDERCGEANYALCAHAGLLQPGYANYFWSPDSALERVGGWEYSAGVTWPVLLDSGRLHPLEHFLSVWSGAVRQFFSVATGDGLGPYGADSFVSRTINERHPGAAAAYASSRQQTGALAAGLGPLSSFHAGLAWAAVLIAFCSVLGLGPPARAPSRGFLGYSLLFCAVHALVCGLILVTDRFQGRVVWLLVLGAAFAALDRLSAAAETADGPSWGRLLGALLAALPVGAFLVVLGLKLASSGIGYTSVSAYRPKPVPVWPRADRVVKEVPLASLSSRSGLAVGAQVKTTLHSGRELIGTITRVGADSMTVEASWEQVKW